MASRSGRRATLAEVKATEYRIVVIGELGSRYRATFEPMQLVPGDGETEIVGRIEDDAELQGILETIAALGLSLVSVNPVRRSETQSQVESRLFSSSDSPTRPTPEAQRQDPRHGSHPG